MSDLDIQLTSASARGHLVGVEAAALADLLVPQHQPDLPHAQP